MTEEEHLSEVSAAIGAGDLRAACRAADTAAQALIGHRLFTVMRVHLDALEVERLYSSRPDVYPVGGRKAKRETAWGAQVLVEGRSFHGAGAADIRQAFGDHEQILGLGLSSVINAPLRRGAAVIGSMNLLDGEHRLRAHHIATVERIADRLAPAL